MLAYCACSAHRPVWDTGAQHVYRQRFQQRCFFVWSHCAFCIDFCSVFYSQTVMTLISKHCTSFLVGGCQWRYAALLSVVCVYSSALGKSCFGAAMVTRAWRSLVWYRRDALWSSPCRVGYRLWRSLLQGCYSPLWDFSVTHSAATTVVDIFKSFYCKEERNMILMLRFGHCLFHPITEDRKSTRLNSSHL